jgi:hypothetical protein
MATFYNLDSQFTVYIAKKKKYFILRLIFLLNKNVKQIPVHNRPIYCLVLFFPALGPCLRIRPPPIPVHNRSIPVVVD